MMHRPDASINSLTDLTQWIAEKIPEAAQRAYDAGFASWQDSLWHAEGASWDDVDASVLEEKLFLEIIQYLIIHGDLRVFCKLIFVSKKSLFLLPIHFSTKKHQIWSYCLNVPTTPLWQ